MAILKPQIKTGSSWSWNLKGPWENGTYPATLVDIIEREDVPKTFKNDSGKDETTLKNTARFLFSYRNDDDEIKFAQSYEYNQTSSTKGHLVKMLASIRGKMPPIDGSYDYCSEIGIHCQIAIEVKVGAKSKEEYGAIVGYSAVPTKLVGDCPGLDEVELPEDRRTEIPEEVKMDKVPTKAVSKKTKSDDDIKSDDDSEEDPF